MVLFENSLRTSTRKKGKQVQRLLDLVEEVVRKNNKKPFLIDLSDETMVTFFFNACSLLDVF